MESKIIKFILSVAGGVGLTYSTIKLPFGGPALNLLKTLNCGMNLGLPFSFASIEEEFIVGFPSCIEVDYVIFALDILIWIALIFVGLTYLNNFFKQKNNKKIS